MLTKFFQRVKVVESGCWLWMGGRDGDGYGEIHVTRRTMKAHRVMWRVFRGDVPTGLELDHLCRVRHCVNPLHLEAVTGAENNRRSNSISARNARKTHCDHGHSRWGKTRNGRRCLDCHREQTIALRARVKQDTLLNRHVTTLAQCEEEVPCPS